MINFAPVMTKAEIYIPLAFVVGGLFEIVLAAHLRAVSLHKNALWRSIFAKLDADSPLSDDEKEGIKYLYDTQKSLNKNIVSSSNTSTYGGANSPILA